ncbi:MAG: hypothetical protein E6Q58_02235 [Niabella sp.]|nr:MAG: hypothetical protein E6Q58_02235 [Niabella sp.]
MIKGNNIKVPNFLVVIIILGGILVFYHFQAKDFKTKILANKAITVGKVINCQYRNKQNYVVEYTFETKNKEVQFGYVNGKEYGRLRSIIVGKTFPLVYDSINSKTNAILIFPNSFEKYGINFPDSLKWVLEYQNN